MSLIRDISLRMVIQSKFVCTVMTSHDERLAHDSHYPSESEGGWGVRPSKASQGGHPQMDDRSSLLSSNPPNGKSGNQFQAIMLGLKEATAGLNPNDCERIMSLVMSLVDHYQFHINRLKSLVEEKQHQLVSLQETSLLPLQRTLELTREENDKLRASERELLSRVEETKLALIEKDKEVSRQRVVLEEEKNRLFHKKLSEQDWLEEVDKFRREITSLRELNHVKEEEIAVLNKNLRALEDEAINLRDQRRELIVKVERLQSQPIAEEKFMFEKSSKYLIDQINSLKRELFKAKSVVESYQQDRELDRQEMQIFRNERRRNSLSGVDFDGLRGEDSVLKGDAHGHAQEDQGQGRRGGSMNYRDTPPRKNTGATPSLQIEEKSANPFEFGFRRRGAGGERRHQNNIDPMTDIGSNQQGNSSQIRGDPHHPSHAQRDPFENQGERKDPNRGSGNIIAADYADETIKGKNPRLIRGTRVDSAKKNKLQTDIGKFYCIELPNFRLRAGTRPSDLHRKTTSPRKRIEGYSQQVASESQEGC